MAPGDGAPLALEQAAGVATGTGLAELVVADAVEVDGVRRAVLAGLDGENCYGPAKLRMVEAWMARERIERRQVHVRAYSDHVSDAPLLAWADEAFAVNAHPPLQALAEARGWPLLDWL